MENEVILSNNQPITNSLGLKKLVTIYVGSLVLTPFSLYWFFKYRKDPSTKKVAYISLAITLVSFAFAIITSWLYVRAVNNYLEQYKEVTDLYSESFDLGY